LPTSDKNLSTAFSCSPPVSAPRNSFDWGADFSPLFCHPNGELLLFGVYSSTPRSSSISFSSIADMLFIMTKFDVQRRSFMCPFVICELCGPVQMRRRRSLAPQEPAHGVEVIWVREFLRDFAVLRCGDSQDDGPGGLRRFIALQQN
jgi:hypothetical protein